MDESDLEYESLPRKSAGTAVARSEELEVPSAIKELQDSVIGIKSATEALLNRLAPVMNDVPVLPSKMGADRRAANAPIADYVLAEAAEIQATTRFIRHVLDLLQV